MDSILKAIFALFNTDTGGSGVHTAVGGRFNIPAAPDRVTFPHIVGTPIPSAPEYAFGTTLFEDLRFQFTIWSDKATDASEAVSILDKLRALFDHAAISFGGTSNDYATVFCNRDSGTGPERDETGDRMVATQDYVMRFQKL